MLSVEKPWADWMPEPAVDVSAELMAEFHQQVSPLPPH